MGLSPAILIGVLICVALLGVWLVRSGSRNAAKLTDSGSRNATKPADPDETAVERAFSKIFSDDLKAEGATLLTKEMARSNCGRCEAQKRLISARFNAVFAMHTAKRKEELIAHESARSRTSPWESMAKLIVDIRRDNEKR